jgi:hypothetical protein
MIRHSELPPPNSELYSWLIAVFTKITQEPCSVKRDLAGLSFPRLLLWGAEDRVPNRFPEIFLPPFSFKIPFFAARVQGIQVLDFLTNFWKAKGGKGDFRLDFAGVGNTSSKIEEKQRKAGEVQKWVSG